MFSLSSTTTFTANSLRAKVTFVKFNASFFKDALPFAKVNDTLSNSSEEAIDCWATDSS